MAYPQESLRKVRIISYAHMAIAAIGFIIGIVQLAVVDHWSSKIAYGMWGGVWIFITGLLGYFSARENNNNPNIQNNPNFQNNNNNNSCLIGTFMAFAIICTIMCGIFLIILGISVSEFNSCMKCYQRDYSYSNYHHNCGYYSWHHKFATKGECTTGRGLASFLLALQLAEFCLAITSAIFCCSAVCCGPAPAPQVVFVPAGGGMVQLHGAQPGQLTYLQPAGQGQVVMATTAVQYPQQYPQQYLQQAPLYQPPAPQAPSPQAWQQGPPPSYEGAGAVGTTVCNEQEGPIPQKA